MRSVQKYYFADGSADQPVSRTISGNHDDRVTDTGGVIVMIYQTLGSSNANSVGVSGNNPLVLKIQ